MKMDLGLVCKLVANHLQNDGVTASAHRSELRIEGGPTIRLRPEGAADDGGLATLFWADVVGLRLEPHMSLDLSGWGATVEDAATEAAHGLLESIVPAVRWLAQVPWRPPGPSAGYAHRLTGAVDQGSPWTVVVGRPWVVAVVPDGAGSADGLAAALREAVTRSSSATIDALEPKLSTLTEDPRGHWLKIYASRTFDGEVEGRIDIDNRVSISSPPFAARIPWIDADALQLVRQLIVLRPDHEAPRPATGSRISRLFGRT